MSNSTVVRNLGLVDAGSDVDIIRGRMTRYDPMAASALAAAEWGIFDPLWTTRMEWNKIDIPPGTSFSGIGNRPPRLDTADFETSLEQLLPGGSRVRADYVTNYLFNPDHPPNLDPNPQYFSYVQFGVVQPLLQGSGTNVIMAPIRIAAAEAERTDWEFKREMLAMVRSIETSYWSLYAQQQNLRALEEALPQFREIVRIREEQAQTTAGTETDVARARSELLLYEQRRLDVISNIVEQQLVLRNLMGLPPYDGQYMTLVALPITAPPVQNVCQASEIALSQRPDVLRQRLAVYVAQQERGLARDALRPRLDFNAFWRINGLGEDLPESWAVINENDYNDWQLGVTLQVPLGRRRARATLRAAELEIQREMALLNQVAHQASFEVADAYRRITWLNQQYVVTSDRVTALTQWREAAKAQFDNPPPGISTAFALEMYLNNLRNFIEASLTANAILAEYNSALARLEEVKGTLLELRLVEVLGDATHEIPEDLPPAHVQPSVATPVPCEPEPAPARPSPAARPQGAPVPAAPIPGEPVPAPEEPPTDRPEAALQLAPPNPREAVEEPVRPAAATSPLYISPMRAPREPEQPPPPPVASAVKTVVPRPSPSR